MDEWLSRKVLVAADGAAMAALTGLLFCVYIITASLTFISDDEIYIFDATESIARHGTVNLSETADLRWPGESDVEPVMPMAAAPLYWLVNSFDGIGNVHGTLLFNPLVTSLTAALVFLYMRQLAYSRATAVVGALAFGLATIAWPYTKTYFRETMATFALFATGYALLRWRDALLDHRATANTWLSVAIIAGLVSMFTKEAALIGLPVLLLILLPGRRVFERNPVMWARIVAVAALTLIVAVLGVWAFGEFFNAGRFDILGRLPVMIKHFQIAQQGILGFLVSPGKSLFLYSPVLIMALAAPIASEQKRKLDVSYPLILMLAFVIIYALVRGDLWWGGTNWGPRYMVPITPFLVIAAAPVIEMATDRRNWLARAAVATLFVMGIGVQVAGVAVALGDYYDVVGSIQPGGPWTLALWTPFYSAVPGHWRLLGVKPPDFAWMQALPDGPAWIVPAAAGGLAVLFAIVIGFALKGELKRRIMLMVAIGGFLATGAVAWVSLRALYYDQRYQGQSEALHQLNATLAQIDSLDPVIFLNNRAYFNFMLNYYKGPVMWYTLELNPRELLGKDEPKPAPDIDAETLVNRNALSVLSYFSSRHQTVYLVNEHGPFTPESPRPMEWWMSQHFHYSGVNEFGPAVRLIRFSSVAAPARETAPAHRTDYRLDNKVALLGWDSSPDGKPVRPGDILNISTQWRALNTLDVDYKIATYLITPQGSVAIQDDSIPVNGFYPTLMWQEGDIIRHNIAFVLPRDLLPGFYEVWTLMYSAADGARLPVQDASGTAIRDHIVLFNIEVTR